VSFDIIFLFGHLLLHFSQVEQFRGLFDFSAELDVELILELETFVILLSEQIGDILFAFGKEGVHIVGPELIDSVNLLIEFVVKVISLSFVGKLHLMKLLIFKLLLAMFPLHSASFCVDVLTLLLMFDHFLVEDSQVLVQT
jgi:hypothetical protein